jgi:hypothetical protein
MKRDARKIALRFAVYTRVSTDSGLDQDFNSFAARHAGSISRRPHQLNQRLKEPPLGPIRGRLHRF